MVNGPVVRGVAAARSAVSMMPVERLPGEGDPFNLVNGVPNMRRAEDIAVPVPNGISVYDMELAKTEQYIENEDEPWHATCRQKVPISKTAIQTAFVSALPFVAPEEGLEDALVPCEDPKAVDAAIAAALAAGARPGCPAIDSAEKLKKEMAKAAKDGKPMPKAKPRKVSAGGDKPGFGLQGEGRALGKVHDNSV